jgi:hypothetical protein
LAYLICRLNLFPEHRVPQSQSSWRWINRSSYLVVLLLFTQLAMGCRSAHVSDSYVMHEGSHPMLRQGIYWHSFGRAANSNEVFLILHEDQYRIVYRGGPDGKQYLDTWGNYVLKLRDREGLPGWLNLLKVNNGVTQLQLAQFNETHWTVSRGIRLDIKESNGKPNGFNDFALLSQTEQQRVLKLPRNEIEAELEKLVSEAGWYKDNINGPRAHPPGATLRPKGRCVRRLWHLFEMIRT